MPITIQDQLAPSETLFIDNKASLRFLCYLLYGTNLHGHEVSATAIGDTIRERAMGLLGLPGAKASAMVKEILQECTKPGVAYERLFASGFTHGSIESPFGQETELGNMDLDTKYKIDLKTLGKIDNKQYCVCTQFTTSQDEKTVAEKERNLIITRDNQKKMSEKTRVYPNHYCLFSVVHGDITNANRESSQFQRDTGREPTKEDIEINPNLNPYYFSLDHTDLGNSHPLDCLDDVGRDRILRSVDFYRKIVDLHVRSNGGLTKEEVRPAIITENEDWIRYTYIDEITNQTMYCKFLKT